MSFFVTRPARPVPGTALISTLCSAAIRRTTGVDLRRSRSSAVSAAPFPPVASPTGLLSTELAVAGAPRVGGAEGWVPPYPPFGGADGAGASGSGWDLGGVDGLGGAGALGGGAAGRVPSGVAGLAAAAPASVSIRATTVCTDTV